MRFVIVIAVITLWVGVVAGYDGYSVQQDDKYCAGKDLYQFNTLDNAIEWCNRGTNTCGCVYNLNCDGRPPFSTSEGREVSTSSMGTCALAREY